jgi:hypothetical protein
MTSQDALVGRVPARPLAEWHEGIGPVLWWTFPIDTGFPVEVTIRDSVRDYTYTQMHGGWPGYHTHWTPIPLASLSPEREAGGVGGDPARAMRRNCVSWPCRHDCSSFCEEERNTQREASGTAREAPGTSRDDAAQAASVGVQPVPRSPVTEAGKGELLPIADTQALRDWDQAKQMIERVPYNQWVAALTTCGDRLADTIRRPSPPSAGVEVVKEARAGFQLVPCLEGRAAWPPEMNDAAAAFYDAHSAAIWRHGSYESFYAGWNAALKVLKALEPK